MGVGRTEYAEGPSGNAGDSWVAAGMPLAIPCRRILCALGSSPARRRGFGKTQKTDGVLPWDGRSREEAESQESHARKVSDPRILRSIWSGLHGWTGAAAIEPFQAACRLFLPVPH